ncbi:hypothetical protein [Pendulispora brunnea]
MKRLLSVGPSSPKDRIGALRACQSIRSALAHESPPPRHAMQCTF